MSHVLAVSAAIAAVGCFAGATLKDWPACGVLPTEADRALGNFFCSCGFFWLAVSVLVIAAKLVW